MTKQEEIREGVAEKAHLVWQRWMAYMLTHLDEEHIKRWTRQANTTYKDLPESEKASDRSIADEYFRYLHSQGVVIKVDKFGLPDTPCKRDGYAVYWRCYQLAQQDMLRAGYVAVEPLIEER